MTKDEVLKLALEALKWSKPHADAEITYNEAITAIKEALEQRSFDYKEHAEGLQRDYDLLLAEYNHLKAQRTLVGLTDEELFKIWVSVPAETEDRFAFARAIEAALRSKNS